jgi:hypothetical protein
MSEQVTPRLAQVLRSAAAEQRRVTAAEAVTHVEAQAAEEWTRRMRDAEGIEVPELRWRGYAAEPGSPLWAIAVADLGEGLYVSCDKYGQLVLVESCGCGGYRRSGQFYDLETLGMLLEHGEVHECSSPCAARPEFV